MYALLALTATLLTSVLPILNKQLLRDAAPAVVAWVINAGSLPLLAIGTVILTQRAGGSGSLVCAPYLPHIDAIFMAAVLGSALLNWVATLLSTQALAAADASLVTPLLTFNPVFTLLVAWVTLGEIPAWRESAGVLVILLGAYLLEVESIQIGALAPLRILLLRPGAVLAVTASALWGITTVLEKLAITHVHPANGPLVALAGTMLTVALLTPAAVRAWPRADHTTRPDGRRTRGRSLGPLRVPPRALAAAVVIAGVAPLFGFTAIALGLVGYVTALFKLSAVLTVLWAHLVLHEGGLRQRLLGSVVMVLGGILVAT